VVLAGGTGFLGAGLARDLVASGYDVVVLTRGSGRDAGYGVRYVNWDARTAGGWAGELDGAEGVINLVGRTVDCRKTGANRREILDSRVDSVRALAAGFARCNQPPAAWVQTATAHIYGDTADEVLDESSPIGTGFAPQVGTAWERALEEADLPGCRRVVLRISFVLGHDGGAMKTLARVTRWFLGGTIGSGRQYMSWIHQADMNALFLRALRGPDMAGVYVATAPHPVTNREFMRELRRALHRPWSPPAPAPLVRLGSWLMRTDPELALLGRRCVPTRLLKEGFTFQFPSLPEALRDLAAPSAATPPGV
jgi:uncharacterized protein (TIGR01777 family)